LIEKFIDHNRYDKVLIFKPDVKWVADGYRWNKDHDVRLNLHNKLKDMYIKHGFNDKIIEVGGSYSERLLKCQDIVDNLLNKYNNRR